MIAVRLSTQPRTYQLNNDDRVTVFVATSTDTLSSLPTNTWAAVFSSSLIVSEWYTASGGHDLAPQTNVK